MKQCLSLNFFSSIWKPFLQQKNPREVDRRSRPQEPCFKWKFCWRGSNEKNWVMDLIFKWKCNLSHPSCIEHWKKEVVVEAASKSRSIDKKFQIVFFFLHHLKILRYQIAKLAIQISIHFFIVMFFSHGTWICCKIIQSLKMITKTLTLMLVVK